MNPTEQEIDFLRWTKRDLLNMLGILEDRIQLLKRRLKKENEN